MRLLDKAKLRMNTEGLNSIEYNVVNITKLALYTHILVKYDEHRLLNNYKNEREKHYRV